MKPIEGLIVAPFTAFTETGEINIGMIKEQADFYKQNGLKGAFICGTTGESSALTLSEKKLLFKEWSLQKTNDFKIIAFLGGTCVKECCELAHYAQKCNLDAIAVTAPYYFKPNNVKELADFCKSIAQSVPEMPFYYYHIPSFTNVYFPMIDLLKEMDSHIPNLAGIKYTYENMMDYQQCLEFKNHKYDILWGRDEMLLAALAIGAKGAVGSTYGYMAPIYHKIMENYTQMNMEEARKYQSIAISFINLLSKYGGGTGKAFMLAAGLKLGTHRQPVTNLTPQQYQSLQADLEKLQFTTYCNRSM